MRNNNSIFSGLGLVYGVVLASVLGFFDALYLSVRYYSSGPVLCAIGDGCEVVLHSPYATFLGIPVSLLGAVYYGFVFIIGIVVLVIKIDRFSFFMFLFAMFGFPISLWFVYLQIFVIGALCFYCIISMVVSFCLFVLGIFGTIRLGGIR